MEDTLKTLKVSPVSDIIEILGLLIAKRIKIVQKALEKVFNNGWIKNKILNFAAIQDALDAANNVIVSSNLYKTVKEMFSKESYLRIIQRKILR